MHESEKVKVKSLGCVRLLATPWTAAHQAPPCMGFSRQEYWSGVPLPSLSGNHSPRLYLVAAAEETSSTSCLRSFQIPVPQTDEQNTVVVKVGRGDGIGSLGLADVNQYIWNG